MKFEDKLRARPAREWGYVSKTHERDALADAIEAMRLIDNNAHAWHGGEKAKARALNVIATQSAVALARLDGLGGGTP
jgi:predicted RNase H-like nuclease (RuvC/YqgF family)